MRDGVRLKLLSSGDTIPRGSVTSMRVKSHSSRSLKGIYVSLILYPHTITRQGLVGVGTLMGISRNNKKAIDKERPPKLGLQHRSLRLRNILDRCKREQVTLGRKSKRYS